MNQFESAAKPMRRHPQRKKFNRDRITPISTVHDTGGDQISRQKAEGRIGIQLTRRERSLESAETLLKKTIAYNKSLKITRDREQARVCIT